MLEGCETRRFRCDVFARRITQTEPRLNEKHLNPKQQLQPPKLSIKCRSGSFQLEKGHRLASRQAACCSSKRLRDLEFPDAD